MSDAGLVAGIRKNSIRRQAGIYALLVFSYVLATLFTAALFMADSVDYAADVIAYEHGANAQFWEVGHLLWRPLGWLLHTVFAGLVVGGTLTSPRNQVMFLLIAFNWLAGLISVICFYTIVRRFCRQEWVVLVSTGALIFSQAFLNFIQTGTSYTAALAMLMLGLAITLKKQRPANQLWKIALPAGAAFAAAVCLWFPFIVAIPGALLSSLFLIENTSRERTSVIATGCAFALFIALVHFGVFLQLGIHNVSGVKAWFASSPSVGTTQTSGFLRMIFGFARSFINMDNDGLLFKRFLINDPFNHVSALELLRYSLWKFVMFYLFLLAVAGNLLSSGRKRILVYLVVSSIPVIAFAILFDGGAVERYLPLYPFLFIVLALSLNGGRVRLPLTVITLGFVLIASINNAIALSTFTLSAQQQRTALRIHDLQTRLKPNSRIYTVNWQDDLVNFNRSFPFNPVNLNGGLSVDSLVTPGTIQVTRWREEFSSRVLTAWERGGDVWISVRSLSDRPQPDWNWAEGADPNISWKEFRPFFAENLDQGETVGDTDGFFLLPPTTRNKEFLKSLTALPQKS